MRTRALRGGGLLTHSHKVPRICLDKHGRRGKDKGREGEREGRREREGGERGVGRGSLSRILRKRMGDRKKERVGE